MSKTWTKNDLIEKIQSEIGISLSDSSKIFEEIIEEILSSLENGNTLALQAIGGGLSWGSLVLKIGKPSWEICCKLCDFN